MDQRPCGPAALNFAIYLVSIWFVFDLYWVSFLYMGQIIRACSRGLFGLYLISIWSVLALYWGSMVFTELASGHELRSHPSLRSSGSLFGLYWVFIWFLLGLYLVSIGSFTRSVFGLYWVTFFIYGTHRLKNN